MPTIDPTATVPTQPPNPSAIDSITAPKVIPSNKYTLDFGFGSAQPPRVERSRNPVAGYSLYRESPNAVRP